MHTLSLPCAHSASFSPPLSSRIQKSVRWTAAPMACAWVARVAVRKAGQAQPATREPAIPAAQSMAPVKTGSVNVARDGTESTVPLVGWLCFTLSSLQNLNSQRCWPRLNKCITLKPVSSNRIFARVSLCKGVDILRKEMVI